MSQCRSIPRTTAAASLLHGVRLELKTRLERWEEYDTVYLGYPNHWNTLPVAVFSFAEKLNWAGKTIRPFWVHEGGGMGRSEAGLRKACPGGCITEGLPIHGPAVRRSLTELEDWLEKGMYQNII